MTDCGWVATRKGLFRIERRGTTRPRWSVAGKPAFLGDNVSMILPPVGDGPMLAALDHGHFGVKLHRSRDGGRRWKEVAVPTMPPLADGEEEWREPNGGKVIPHAVLRIWALERGTGADSNAIWCGTIPGGLFRSEDQGDSWSFVSSLWNDPRRKEWFGGGADYPGIHSVAVHPTDGNQVTVGVSCGGVWISGDRGATWDCPGTGMRAEYMPPARAYDAHIQDPHRVVSCEARPESLWVQHHNGIFRSIDAGASWSEITEAGPSTFGFAVAVHPGRPDTAWFVPAIKDERRIPVGGKMVVTRTRDGGKSFEVLTKGLPQRHAFDLVYRHGLDIDGTGERLLMGSTTGGVWVTENGGDAWQAVAARMPPVYAVRWG